MNQTLYTTKVIPQSDDQSAAEVLAVLRNQGVVALPTDTVYGIAGLVSSSAAIMQLYAIKSRDALKAIPVLISDIWQVSRLSNNFSAAAQLLAQHFWPGALTLILSKQPDLPAELSANETVGIRMPAHEWLRDIMRQCGPLATTSANLSGGANPITAQEVQTQLDGRLELIVDGGTCQGGIPSTVVDCSDEQNLRIVRQGAITAQQISQVLKTNFGLEM